MALCAEPYVGRNYGKVNVSNILTWINKAVGGYWTCLVRYQLVCNCLTSHIRQYLAIESGRIPYIRAFWLMCMQKKKNILR